MAQDDVRHPDAERLAEYADGVIESGSRADVERHLVDCPACRAVVMETMAFLDENPTNVEHALAATIIPFRSRRWVTGVAAALALAAALVLAVFVARPAWLFGPRSDRPELQELIAAVANEPTRPVEGRLSGGFKYAPPPSQMRGSRERETSAAVRIAAAKIEKLAREADTPANRAALATAYLVLGDVDRAVEVLESTVVQEPTRAGLHSDLSAAYLARAARSGRPDDVQRALSEADAAIRLNSNLPEAWFNRALAKQQMPAPDGSGWRDYLEHDSGPWSREAREQLPPRGKAAVPIFLPITNVPSTAPQVRVQFFDTQFSTQVRTISAAFPAEFYADNVQCSATWVGQHAVITAAHCFPEETGEKDQWGNPIWRVLVIDPGMGQIDGYCRRPSGFRESDPQAVRASWDWALCYMDNSANVEFEVISVDPAVVRKNDEVLITGFGSDSSNPGLVFRVGNAKVTNDPVADRMIRACGEGLELGDSGGGTYVYFDAQFVRRFQISVNSAKDGVGPCPGQSPGAVSKFSLVAPLWRAEPSIQRWHADLGVAICGVHAGAVGCRNPPVPGTVLTQ